MFGVLKDDLQIPSTLRPKLATMDSTVKAAMLKSSHVLNLNTPEAPTTPRTLRKAHSSESLVTPYTQRSIGGLNFPDPPFLPGSALGSQGSTSSIALNGGLFSRTGHARGSSVDVSQQVSRGQVPLVIPAEFTNGKLTKDKSLAKAISPAKFCSILTGTSSTQLDLETVKKLRLMLRNESARYEHS